MYAKIERSGCISCGLCASICPNVFVMADDGIADVISEVGEDNIDLVKRAVSDCPVSVISVQL